MFTRSIHICPNGKWVKSLPSDRQDGVRFQGFFLKKSTCLKCNLIFTKYLLMSQWHMGIVLALSWTDNGSTLAISLSFYKISTSLNNYFMFTKRIHICPSGKWVKCLPLVEQDRVQFQGLTSLFLR